MSVHARQDIFATLLLLPMIVSLAHPISYGFQQQKFLGISFPVGRQKIFESGPVQSHQAELHILRMKHPKFARNADRRPASRRVQGQKIVVMHGLLVDSGKVVTDEAG
jgi:hypothetical protein